MVQYLLNTLINFIFRPTQAWKSIQKNNLVQQGFTKVGLPMIILHALINLAIHLLKEGLSNESVYSSLIIGTGTITGSLLAIILSAYLLRALLKNEKITVTGTFVISLLSYAAIPFYIAGILASILPSLQFIHVFGFYSFYILAIGVKELLSLPEEKRGNFIILSSLLIIAVFSIVAVINAAVVSAMVR